MSGHYTSWTNLGRSGTKLQQVRNKLDNNYHDGFHIMNGQTSIKELRAQKNKTKILEQLTGKVQLKLDD